MLKPDITETLTREGIEVTRNKAHCPFHQDDTPSFMVYPESNSWYCFGCGIGGDAINFIMRHRELSFKQAIHYIGVKDRKPCKRDILRRDLLSKYRLWVKSYMGKHNHYMKLIDYHKSAVKTIDDMHPEIYHMEEVLEYRIEKYFDAKKDKDLLSIYIDDSVTDEKFCTYLGKLLTPTRKDVDA